MEYYSARKKATTTDAERTLKYNIKQEKPETKDHV